jgi:ATP-dependent Lon protease
MKPRSKQVKPSNSSSEVDTLVSKKITYFQDVIQRTIAYVQQNKWLNIISVGDYNACINNITALSKHMNNPDLHGDNAINILQLINNELSTIFKSFGTSTLDDLLFICFGSSNIGDYASSPQDIQKFDLLKRFFHPTGYKIQNKTEPSLKCEELTSAKTFHMKVHGIQLTIHPTNKRGLVITGTVDDILFDVMNNPYISHIQSQIQQNKPQESVFSTNLFDSFLASLTLKDYLISSTEDIYSKFMGYNAQINTFNQKTVHVIVKEFIGNSLFLKRNAIMMLLINNTTKNDNQYLAYLLYDLMSNDSSSGNIDTQEQITLFDSLPHAIKNSFRTAMKKTVQYTTELSEFDTSKIPIEQQICLMNVADSVKEKAMQKLKEVKSKSEDSCSKAKQYLDGLLKIPFGINRKEPILCVVGELKHMFSTIKDKEYTIIEIVRELTNAETIQSYKTTFSNWSKTEKNDLHNLIPAELSLVLPHSNKSKTTAQLSANIDYFIDTCFKTLQFQVLSEWIQKSNVSAKQLIYGSQILNKYSGISSYMKTITNELDTAVYGHSNAKRQIEHIIAQWINGKQDGYCFGFEGPPGVGKTSLAKCGLSRCLKNEDGDCRPFAMIQMGGDSNGSTLHGHNYTYVGATWGSIVQILMDKKCMNPIIFIDEVDKISKTEHGKEIVGILTHLLDPAQNDCFQDRYFTGINLNLSNALFILSYNDAELIDPILLDRIHRIKFDSLSTEDKIVIANKHIIPDICNKMGLEGMIEISADALVAIIDEYTNESGVRKLKEMLFEIIAEINLELLKTTEHPTLPIVITIPDIKSKYLKDKHEVRELMIHSLPSVGIMNGLWANAVGKGGIIPVQACFFPSNSTFDLKLTGMQGDVMKESMNVALTLAWKLTSKENQDKYMTHKMGIHIHCPDGATPKDGPSAGACITTAIYSLINNSPIPNTFAMTGEINLQGKVSMIGGLQLKILGAIKAGVKNLLYPVENSKDFLKFMKKYEKNAEGITFHPVKTIEEVLTILFSYNSV